MRHCKLCGYWSHTLRCDRCNLDLSYTYIGGTKAEDEYRLARIQQMQESQPGLMVPGQPDGGLFAEVNA